MNTLYAMTFGALGVILAILFIRAARAMRGRENWNAATVLGLAAVLLPNATTTVAVFLGNRTVVIDGFYNGIVTYGGVAARVNSIASPILAVIAIICLGTSLRPTTRPNPAPFAIAGLILLSLIFGAFYGGTFFNGGILTLLLVLLAAVFVPRGRGTLEGASLGLATLVVLSFLGAIVRPAAVAATCGLRKCGGLGFLYSGIADNNNAFGLLAAMAIPVLYFGLRKHQLFFAAAAALLAVSSGSRTGAIAAAAGLLLCALYKRPRLRSFGGGLAALSAAALGAGVIILPLLPLTPDAFTGRVALWRTAFDEMAKQPFLGHGGEFWRQQVNFRVIAHAAGYSTHNQFVEAYFVGGIFGVILLLVAIIVVIRRNRGNLRELSILLVPILVCALTERPWSLGLVDWLSWSFLIVLTAQFTADADSPPSPPAARPARRPAQRFRRPVQYARR